MWRLLHGESKKGYINSLGALTGGQALQQAKAGIEAVYLSGWQVAADANLAASMYPDQSLYPANSVPAVVERINNMAQRYEGGAIYKEVLISNYDTRKSAQAQLYLFEPAAEERKILWNGLY